MTKKRFLLALALMLTAVGGAWAQGHTTPVNWNAATKTGTLTVPAGNVTLSVDYYGQYTLDSVPTAEGWQVKVNGSLATVTPYTPGSALGHVDNINETDSVELIPPAELRGTIKAVRLTESVAVQNLTISGLVLDITDCTTWEEVVARNTAVIKCPGNHVKRVDNDQSLCYATSGSPVQKTTALDTNADYIWQYAE